MANPSGTHHEHPNPNPNLNNGNSVPESSNSSLKHNPGISSDWTPEEQAVLDDGLAKYAAESIIIRYAKIAIHLPNKTVRDVALRCRWMSKKENSKRRKEDNLGRKPKDKKERVTDLSAKSSNFMARSNVPPFSTSMMPTEYDDGISFKAIGGVTGELLEQNAQALGQISENLSNLQIQDNINLLCQTRDNLLKIISNMNEKVDIMSQMPPLPVKINEELANTILPRPNLSSKKS